MENSRTINRKLWLLGWVLFVFLFRLSFSGTGDWTTYTNMNYITEVLLDGEKLWCATTGGAVILNINDGSLDKLTNVDGLGGNQLYSLTVDSGGGFWLGAQNGTLTKYQLEENTWKVYNFIDRDGSRLRINHIVPDGDRLWIATDAGVSLFLIYKHGGEIKETYRRLGEHLQGGEEANAIHLMGKKVWVGLTGGVATADRNDPNLLDPSRWFSFTTESSLGLANDTVNCVTDMDSYIVIGTKKGVYQFDPSDSTWHSLGLEDRIINDLNYFDQKLYAATNAGIYVYEDQTWSKISTEGLLLSYFNSLIIDGKGTIWAGTAGYGISAYDGSGWENYRIDGPPANLFLDMEMDDDGNLWCAQGRYKASLFDQEVWISLDTVPEIGRHSIQAVEKDLQGNIWFSSWGGGVTKHEPDSNWIRYTEENSPLKGVLANPAYVVVNDITMDEKGNRWFPNWEALDSTRVVCSPAQSETMWVVFYEQDGIRSELMPRVLAKEGHLYICTQDNGLFDYDYNWTLDDKDDDQVIHYTKKDHHLSDDAVWCVNVDKDGVLWTGTSSGLDKFDPDFERFRSVPLPDLLGPQVNDIAVDERNNKWIATSNGLGKINSKGEFVEVFTTFNSKLCANNVLRLKIDRRTGDVWVGTDNGLSRFESGVGAPAENLSKVIPFPNPFLVRNGTERLTFDRLPYEAEVRIFTIAGELIKKIESGNQWDGRNQAGELVASGVYLFHIQSPFSESATGKIAVIRE